MTNNNDPGALDDMLNDLSAPGTPEEPEEEKPSLGERAEDIQQRAQDLKEKIEKGKEQYQKLKQGTKGAKEGKQAAATGAKAAKAGATAAKAGATAAKTGAAAAEVGAAAGAGAATGGIGAIVVLAADLAVRAGKWVKEHRKTVLWIVAFLIFLSLLNFLIFSGLLSYALSGPLGKVIPQPAGKNDPNIAKLISFTTQKANTGAIFIASGPTVYKVEFLHSRDKEYVESGQIDKRLLAALVYIAEKHEHIQISHIVSGYEDMKIDTESGALHDQQINMNISAHKDGLAADIDQIDLVKRKCSCGAKIPVVVAWQTMGENPYGETPANVLNNIKSPIDLLQDDVKAALEKVGVKGLDQPGIEEKLAAVTGLSSVYDLTKPEVIDALKSINITGIDNADFQAGLKRMQALQGLYDLDLQDLDALTNPNGPAADLLNQIGVQITPEVETSIKKYQAGLVLTQINSVDDLADPSVQQALRDLDIDPNDQNFKDALDKMNAANTILNWQGDTNSQVLTDALTKLEIQNTADIQQALDIYQAAQGAFSADPGTILANPDIYVQLEKMGISLDNPDAQQIYNTYRNVVQLAQWARGVSDFNYQILLDQLGLPYSTTSLPFYEKYQAAQYIANFDGDLSDPQLKASLEKLGVPTDILSNAADIQTTLNQLRQLDPMKMMQQYAANLPTQFPAEWQKYQDFQALLNINSLDDLNSQAVKTALNNFGINFPAQYQDLLKLTEFGKLANIRNINDLTNLINSGALKDLNLPPNLTEQLGRIGSISALANIHSPLDLARSDVQAALKDLGIDMSQFGDALGQAADFNALLSIRGPEDLLRPDVLKAMDDLGIIDLNSELLGQIGAFQALLSGDIFSVNGVLALNSLGIISLSNPVIAALTVINIISNVLGIDLPGQCNGDTKCYKPTAQANVHKVISELLQFPYDMNDPKYYRVTQLITFSEERDVTPFADQLDDLYYRFRPKNYGLFAMPEAWDHLHIAY